MQDKNSLSYYKRQVCKDAADAIEALEAEAQRQKDDAVHFQLLYEQWKESYERKKRRADTYKELFSVMRKECIHFTQGGWCDREFDWFPVDENDFCSMAEKMEVQEW